MRRRCDGECQQVSLPASPQRERECAVAHVPLPVDSVSRTPQGDDVRGGQWLLRCAGPHRCQNAVVHCAAATATGHGTFSAPARTSSALAVARRTHFLRVAPVEPCRTSKRWSAAAWRGHWVCGAALGGFGVCVCVLVSEHALVCWCAVSAPARHWAHVLHCMYCSVMVHRVAAWHDRGPSAAVTRGGAVSIFSRLPLEVTCVPCDVLQTPPAHCSHAWTSRPERCTTS